MDFSQRIIFKLQRILPKFLKTIPPYAPLRVLGGVISKTLVKKGMAKRMGKLDDEDFNAIGSHLFQVSMRSGSAENAIHIMFTHNFVPCHPLIEDIESENGFKANNIDTCFIYGDSDWLDLALNGLKISEVLKEEGHNVHVLPDSDHHLYFDNPEELLNIIQTQLAEI